jgi:hypothetical protein
MMAAVNPQISLPAFHHRNTKIGRQIYSFRKMKIG